RQTAAMPTSLTFADHLAAIETSGRRLLVAAVEVGFDAPVPTCPAWAVDALVAHQTMVHRWATANIRGEDPDAVPNQTTIRSTVADLSAYYEEGLNGLIAALLAAPPDLKAMTFLNDAPAPREFWARRQAHETTVHMVDALAAVHGQAPSAADLSIEASLAVDGVDELLRGFYTRGRSKLFDGEELTVLVAPTDSPRRWVVRVAERLTVEPDDGSAIGGAFGATVTGTAASIYLALWNRGDEVELTGRPDLLARWRQHQKITWS
ncbi:MAG TPA: maleylpyruvate isomerase N-terminal domain-containing protein, partial [Acidimicrobiales bacterium]